MLWMAAFCGRAGRNGVLASLSGPERLLRRYWEHVKRKRRGMRGAPDLEARGLGDKLQKLEVRWSGYIDLAADAAMSLMSLQEG
jgi:hypothetical protein